MTLDEARKFVDAFLDRRVRECGSIFRVPSEDKLMAIKMLQEATPKDDLTWCPFCGHEIRPLVLKPEKRVQKRNSTSQGGTS